MITRRRFVQLGSATLVAAKSLLWGRNSADQNPASPVSVTPRRSVCYLYNPGADLTDIKHLTFSTVRSLPGGQVTRITDAFESMIHIPDYSEPEKYGRFGRGVAEKLRREGRLHEEEVPTGELLWIPKKHGEERYWTMQGVTEKRDVITYLAKEILIGLLSDNSIYKNQVVEIKAWENKDVDLEAVNKLIAGKTVNERRKALLALPIAWRMTSALRPIALASLAAFEFAFRWQLIDRVAQTFAVDMWQVRHAQLLEINLAKLTNEKKTVQFPIQHGSSIEEYRRAIQEYDKQVKQRLRIYLLDYIGPDPVWVQSELDRHLRSR